MTMPTRARAEALLQEAQEMSSGRWPDHVRHVARAAEAIASHHPALDPDRAYILGLLHDIGRRTPNTDMRHVIDGYRYLMALGYDEPARICLTHSFALQDVHAHAGVWDCPEEDVAFVAEFLASITYTDEDRLIQLCDALALPDGPCLLEKRLVDVALRHGNNAYTLPRWRATFALKAHFEAAIGGSIYALLPGVVETTFGWEGTER